MVCPFQGRTGHEEEVRSEPPSPDPWEFANTTQVTPPLPHQPEVVVDPAAAESNALNILVQEKFRQAMEEENLPPVPPEDMGKKAPGPGGVPIKLPALVPAEVEEVEKLKTPEPVTARAAATPTPTPIIAEMNGLLEGAYKGGAIAKPTGVGLDAGQLSQALAKVATTNVAQVNNLALNEQMGLMEQTMVEQFKSGQVVQSLPAAESPALAKNYPAGVPQAGVSPTLQTTVAKNKGKIIQAPSASVLPYQGFIVQAMMELAFGGASKAVAPAAGKLIQFPAKPVVNQVKEFGGFLAALLP